MAEGISARTGFVDGGVWFSEEILNLDQTVKVYIAVFNGEESRLSVKVDFINGTTAIASKEIVVSPNETKTVSIDWKVAEGSHNIYAIISKANISGEEVSLSRIKTDSVRFSVTKDSPGNVVKNVLASKFSSVFEGEEGFLNKADSWFKLNFTKSEEWREKKLLKIKDSKELVEKTRSQNKEEGVSNGTKIISFLHFYFLVAAEFVFSISVVFYLLAISLCYLVFRTIWRVLRNLFRKKYEE